jgi:hypothetical protein
MTAGQKGIGFQRDLSAEAQGDRARKAKSPWRTKPMVRSNRAMNSGKKYMREAAIRAACGKVKP